MHVVIYLPTEFYSAIASAIVETLQAVNEVSGAEIFTVEFVAARARAISRSGIAYPAAVRASRKMDVLILLAGLRPEVAATLRLLEEESERAQPLIKLAQRQQAIVATTCGAAWLLAAAGMLDGKRATISWWLKHEARERFPQVRWEPSRLLIRQGRIYTTRASFAGLELITALLRDLGLRKEERQVRKLMLIPPSRELQSPYEFALPGTAPSSAFEKQLDKLAKERLRELSLPFLAAQLSTSSRTLSRRLFDGLRTSPGKWIQEKRLECARTLLETTQLSIAEICYRVGYQDLASFSRLFSRTSGMAPGEFRKQIRS